MNSYRDATRGRGERPAWRPLRVVVAAGLLAVLLAVGAGCGGGEEDDAGGGAVTLRYMPHVTPATPEAMYRELVEAFQKEHPDIKVELIVPPSTDDASFLPRLLQSDNAPDVLYTPEPTSLIKAQQLRPLAVDAEVKRIQGYENAISPDGKLYTLASGTTGDGFVYYNTDAFAKAGITQVPTTTAEFGEALGKIKDAGYEPLSCGNTWMAAQYLFVFMLNELAQEHPDWVGARNDGQYKFSDPDGAAVRALSEVQDWYKAGYFGKGCLADDYTASSARLVSGKAAMYIQGGWYSGNKEVQESEVPLDVFLMPSSDGKPRLAVRSEMITHGVLAKTQHPEEAETLARWLTFSDIANPRIVGGENALPKVEGAPAPIVENEVTAKLGETMTQLLNSAEKVDDFIGSSSNPVPGGILDPATKAFEKIMLGGDPAKELQALDEFWESQ